jgi:hypothetical protein
MTGCSQIAPRENEAPTTVEALGASQQELELWEDRLAYLRQLRALLHCAAAETPPGDPPPKKRAGAAFKAPALSSNPSTATRPLSTGGSRRA